MHSTTVFNNARLVMFYLMWRWCIVLAASRATEVNRVLLIPLHFRIHLDLNCLFFFRSRAPQFPFVFLLLRYPFSSEGIRSSNIMIILCAIIFHLIPFDFLVSADCEVIMKRQGVRLEEANVILISLEFKLSMYLVRKFEFLVIQPWPRPWCDPFTLHHPHSRSSTFRAILFLFTFTEENDESEEAEGTQFWWTFPSDKHTKGRQEKVSDDT